MGRTALALLLLSMLFVPSPGAAGATLVYDYEVASPVSTPWFKTNVALCDHPDHPCIGGAVFPIRERNVIATISDDITGSDAPLLLCVWRPGGAEACTAEDATTQAGCGPQVLVAIPFTPEKGVVYTYMFHIDHDLDFCLASRGTLSISTF